MGKKWHPRDPSPLYMEIKTVVKDAIGTKLYTNNGAWNLGGC